jgi:hypothetical protein
MHSRYWVALRTSGRRAGISITGKNAVPSEEEDFRSQGGSNEREPFKNYTIKDGNSGEEREKLRRQMVGNNHPKNGE